MNRRAIVADLLLLVTACIWGFGFVAQRSGMEYVGPFAFNSIRFLLGSISLLPLIIWRTRRGHKVRKSGKSPLLPCLAAGTIICIAVMMQQFGLMFTTEGKSGFITGFYVVLTPIFGLVLGKKTGVPTWIGMLFSLAGLYFISVFGQLGQINPGDAITFVSALFWTAHVLLIDHLVQDTDPIVLSAGQFAVCGLYTLIGTFAAEPAISQWIASSSWVQGLPQAVLKSSRFAWIPFPSLIGGLASGTIPLAQVQGAVIPLLYGAFGSVGIAYTLQCVAQRDAPPAHATIIMCLEGSFAALGGVLIGGNRLEWTTTLGFALMLAGMIASQWDIFTAGRLQKA
jgi:drug/metabolite transporter (DMT)-like permease